jgi:hypothetical protein
MVVNGEKPENMITEYDMRKNADSDDPCDKLVRVYGSV